jgi:vacuolar-type H+-ATPase subunit E/Vma4
MSEPVNSMPEEGMVEKIIGDARSEADRAIKNAERSVEAERRKAQNRAEAARQEILESVQRKADRLRSKEIASAQIESKRLLLKAREQAIAGVLEIIEQGVVELREDPSRYRKALRKLAAEAVTAVDLPEVLLRVAPEDAALTEGGFIAEVAGDVKTLSGRDVQIRIEIDSDLPSGGCIAASGDGRIIYDNTFRRRLERMKPGLRSLIVREVLKD